MDQEPHPTSLQPNTAYILFLPNEPLHRVCSVVCAHEQGQNSFVKVTDASGHSHYVHQVLVLRSVSQRFRFVANRVDLWYRDSFEFSSLQVQPSLPRLKPSIAATSSSFTFILDPPSTLPRELKFTRRLLGDDDLVRCLDKKVAWTFSRHETFNVIVGLLPLLRQSVRRVSLRFFDYENPMLYETIQRLRICPHISELSIHFSYVFYDIEIIGHSCPVLRSLSLHNVYNLTGQLANNTKLEELTVCMAEFTLFYAQAIIFPWVLPLGSATTLRRLKIKGFSPEEMIEYDLDMLVPFRSLEEFEMTWFLPEICAMILRAEFKLRSLAIGPLESSNDLFTDLNTHERQGLLSAPSLPALQELNIIIRPSKDQVTGLIDLITSNLPYSVSTLGLYFYDFDFVWCRYFSRLWRLSKLYLATYPHFLQPNFMGKDCNIQDDGGVIEKTLKEGFVESDEIPDLRINI